MASNLHRLGSSILSVHDLLDVCLLNGRSRADDTHISIVVDEVVVKLGRAIGCRVKAASTALGCFAEAFLRGRRGPLGSGTCEMLAAPVPDDLGSEMLGSGEIDPAGEYTG